MKLEKLKVFGTQVGSEQQAELDEVTVLASPDTLQALGKFLMEAAEDMKLNGVDHAHLQDFVEDFSYEEHADFVLCNSDLIKMV